jgi:hypothetical protein
VALTFDLKGIACTSRSSSAAASAAHPADPTFAPRRIPSHTHTPTSSKPKSREPLPPPRSDGAPPSGPEKSTLGARGQLVRCHGSQPAHNGASGPVIRHSHFFFGREEQGGRKGQEVELAWRSTTSYRNAREDRAAREPPDFPNTRISKRGTFSTSPFPPFFIFYSFFYVFLVLTCVFCAGSRTISRHASIPPNRTPARAGKTDIRHGCTRPMEQSRQQQQVIWAFANAVGGHEQGQGVACKRID